MQQYEIGDKLPNFYSVKHLQGKKRFQGRGEDCLTFNLNGHLFEFVYYYPDWDTQKTQLNVVFNGDNSDVLDSNNIHDFEFYECTLDKDFKPFPHPRPNGTYQQIPTVTLDTSDPDKFKPLQGNLNHITYHPITHTHGLQNLEQRINLHLNSNSAKLKLSNLERTSPEKDELFTFYIKNSYLDIIDDTKLTVISLNRNFKGKYDAGVSFARDISHVIGGTQQQQSMEFFTLSELNNEISPQDNFAIFIKKDCPNFAQMDEGDINMHGLNKKDYLNVLLQKMEKENKNGFVIIGNPEYCFANNQSIFVGFLN